MEQIPRLARITTNSDSFPNVGSALSSLISPAPFKPLEGEEIICARFASKYTEFGQSLLLLGYQQGFQVWNVDMESKHAKEIVSLRTGARVLAMEYLEYPEPVGNGDKWDSVKPEMLEKQKADHPDKASKAKGEQSKSDQDKFKGEQQERNEQDKFKGELNETNSVKSEKPKNGEKSNQKAKDKNKSEPERNDKQQKIEPETSDIIMRHCVFILQSGSSGNSKNSSLTGSVYSLHSGKFLKELKFDIKQYDFELVRISKYFIAIVKKF